MDYEERERLSKHFEEHPEDYAVWDTKYSGMNHLDVAVIRMILTQTPEQKKELDKWREEHGFIKRLDS